jgi:hypothetical protein
MNHVDKIAKPFAANGYGVEVYLSSYRCDGDQGRAMMAKLEEAYSPFMVHAEWMVRQKASDQRSNRTIGTNDQYSNTVSTLFNLANFSTSPPDVTVLLRIDLNFTMNIHELLAQQPSADKIYMPFALGPKDSELGILADTFWIVPSTYFTSFACSVCDPTQCYGTCEGFVGTECPGNMLGHTCRESFDDHKVPWGLLFPGSIGFWEANTIMENRVPKDGQPYHKIGNPLYTMPLREKPVWDDLHETPGISDGDDERLWGKMALAMNRSSYLKALLPLELFVSVIDKRIQAHARNLWRRRCNKVFSCGFTEEEPPASYPDGELDSQKRHDMLKDVHAKLLEIRQGLEPGQSPWSPLTEQDAAALLKLYRTAISSKFTAEDLHL